MSFAQKILDDHQTITELRAENAELKSKLHQSDSNAKFWKGEHDRVANMHLDATHKLTESEASCAAMREFVTGCVGHYMAMDHGESGDNLFQHIFDNGRKAMATTSGSELLGRLERYEKALERISRFKRQISVREIMSDIDEEIDTRTSEAIIARQALTPAQQQSEGTK